jgi:hypothetical protein
VGKILTLKDSGLIRRRELALNASSLRASN